jgi:hypothetical protein
MATLFLTLDGTLSDATAERLTSAIQAQVAAAAGIKEALVSVSVFAGSIIARVTLPGEAAVLLRQKIDSNVLTSLADLPITQVSAELPREAISAAVEHRDTSTASAFSTGAIAGIVVACVALLSAGAGLLVFIKKCSAPSSRATASELPVPASQSRVPGSLAGRPSAADEPPCAIYLYPWSMQGLLPLSNIPDPDPRCIRVHPLCRLFRRYVRSRMASVVMLFAVIIVDVSRSAVDVPDGSDLRYKRWHLTGNE